MTLPDYLQTPGILIADKAIKPIDYMIYGVIYWVVGMKLQKCFMSNKQFGKMLGVSESSISHGISRLKKKGYITAIMDEEKNHRLELIPNIVLTPPSQRTITPQQETTTPQQPVATPLQKTTTPPSKILLHNKTNLIKDISSNELIGHGAKRNKEVDLIITQFDTHIGHIPSDKYPRRVAQNIRQITQSFIKRNNENYRMINHGRELTPEYVLERTWAWYDKKDYAETTEKLETFKLKMKVFLADIEKRFARERSNHDQKNLAP